MKILTIDGNNLLYRVYWISKNQEAYTQSLLISNFLKSIKTYTEKFSPEKIICTWDKKLQDAINFRQAQDENYKSNREKNDEIYDATYPLDEIMETMGIKIMYPYHLEADDIMHYISIKNDNNVIVSTDKDILQLVSETTKVYNPVKKTVYTNDNFKYFIGNSQKEFLMIKAIIGDQSDNIKGIKGYGIKRAKKLIQQPELITEEQLQIIEKNLNIMDLSRGWTLNSPGEELIYREQFNKPWPKAKETDFYQKCIENSLISILTNKNSWKIFFKEQTKSKLEELLA